MLVWRGVVWHAMTAVGAFKRVLPLICDAKFGVQRGAGFTVSMLQMLANLNPSQSYTKPSGGCAAGRRTYSEHAADAARRCCGSAFCCYLECPRAVRAPAFECPVLKGLCFDKHLWGGRVYLCVCVCVCVCLCVCVCVYSMIL